MVWRPIEIQRSAWEHQSSITYHVNLHHDNV